MSDKEKSLEIRVSLVGAEEVIEQLKIIKKLLDDIKNPKVNMQKNIIDLKNKLINQLYGSSNLRNLEKEIELLDIILRNK